MARTARWMARVVTGFVMAGVVLVVPITVATAGPTGRPAVVAGAGTATTVTTVAATTVVGGSVCLGRRWG
jgi:pantothenate kinase type III